MRNTVHLAFIWHMHQPPYAVEDDEPRLPWVRLHALRAYYDMAWMLERHPKVRCAVNLSACLIEQLRALVEDGVRDRWFRLSEKPAAELDDEERLFIIKHFFSINWKTVVDRIPRYAALLALRGKGPNRDVDATLLDAFQDQDLLDLQVLFNLAWFGFAAREELPELNALLAKGAHYSEEDKARVLQLQLELASRILPSYLRLAQRQQLELSTNPANHPILPLLIDTQIAERPGRELPPRFAYPQDAAEQIANGRATLAALTGELPQGMWPSEGAVSDAALSLMAANGVRWCATDERNLLEVVDCVDRSFAIYHPWRFVSPEGKLDVLFRDTVLSDLIGFQYRRMSPRNAARDLVRRVLRAGREARDRGVAIPLVCLALDGENPWEHYHDDGRSFLEELYRLLARMEPTRHQDQQNTPRRRASVQTVRPCDFLQRSLERSELRHINPGSWIEGDYAIWIGHRAKNRAWELLGEVRAAVAREIERRGDEDASTLDEQLDTPAEREIHSIELDPIERAIRNLARAEASDWFWWYGPNYTTGEDTIFDGLFRDHLRRALDALGLEPSQALGQPVEERHNRARGESYREPTGPLQLRFDTDAAAEAQWRFAGEYVPPRQHSTMLPQALLLRRALLGRSQEQVFVRLDLDESLLSAGFDASFELWCGDRRLRALFSGLRRDETGARFESTRLLVDQDELTHLRLDSELSSRSLVVALPLAPLGAHPGLELGLFVRILSDGLELMRVPRKGVLDLPALSETAQSTPDNPHLNNDTQG